MQTTPDSGIAGLMSTRLVTVEFDDRLSVVKDIFDAMKFHHLLVVADGQLAGIISDRDLLRALSPFIGTLSETSRDLGTLDKRAHQIMTRNPVTLRPDAPVGDALRLFAERKISCVPVVDERGRPVGVLSWRDVLRHVIAT
jgi:acetoin utilization protein AcuB